IALTQDADNVSAHRRLGQIALAQGDYALAQQHLLAAHAVAPHDRATQQLLGEIYALTGKRPEAVRLWQRIDVSHGQLDVRLTWYASLGNSHHLQQMQEAIDFYERGTAL